jgi:hypothetical protein
MMMAMQHPNLCKAHHFITWGAPGQSESQHLVSSETTGGVLRHAMRGWQCMVAVHGALRIRVLHVLSCCVSCCARHEQSVLAPLAAVSTSAHLLCV